MASDSNWNVKDATIYSAEWIEPQGKNRGCWRVTYSYWVDAQIYSGSMTDFATDAEVNYQKGDPLRIEYSQKYPAKSRVPTVVTYWQKARMPFLLGASFGLIAIVLYVLTHVTKH
jgi:hypothetical protein